MCYYGRALTIAGSDSSGGAGIQADLKTFQIFNVYGSSVITAITAQNTYEIKAIHQIPHQIIAAQISAVMEDIGADAVKVGMLLRKEIVEVVAENIKKFNIKNLIVDPVMISKSGVRLLEREAEKVLFEKLLPLALMLTPNIPETETITEMKIKDLNDVKKAAKMIHSMGPQFVLIKGGHLTGQKSIDTLYNGNDFYYFESDKIDTLNLHGVGCTFSAAITANIALKKDIVESVKIAKNYVISTIKNTSFTIGKGYGPLFHNINF
jgi:hydroxymethylpyrimidine/phosphomethylpyrimidine kinase